MNATFYKGFKKRVNSTKVPSGGTTHNVVLKDPTDIHAPTLKVNTSEYGYTYFSFADHYYFVESAVVMPNNWVEYTGAIDPMATWAEEIKGTKVFVNRSSAGSERLIDEFAPAIPDLTPDYEDSANIFNVGGTFVVTLSNYPTPMLMNQLEMSSLYDRLHADDIVEQIQNVFADFSDFVGGAFWVPYNIRPRGLGVFLKAGKVDLGITGQPVDGTIIEDTVNFHIPTGDSSLFSSKYRSLRISLPHCGTTELSIDDFKSGLISVYCTLDPYTGGIIYEISSSEDVGVIASFSGSCAVPIALGSTGRNIGAIGTGIASTVIGAATSNPIAIASGIITTFEGLRTTSQIGGGFGGTQTTIHAVRVSSYSKPVPEPLSNKKSVVGLPTLRTMSVGSVSGFIQCINASVAIDGAREDAETINNYLNSGAWIE